MGTLPIFVRMEGRACMLLGDGAAADAKRRLLKRAGATIVDESAAAALAVVAIENEAEAVAAVDRLRRRGVLVNVVDRLALCDWTMPAIVDRDPVIVAIGTDGRSAGLAKALRQRLELLLPADLGRIAESMFAARARLATAFPAADDRRRAIDAAFEPGGPLDPLSGRAPDLAWIEQHRSAPGGQVERMRLTSGDPDDLTLRQARLLGQADRVVHRAHVPAAILDRARADAERICSETVANSAESGLTVDIGIMP